MITVMRQAHQAVEDARARGQPALDAGLLAGLGERYDETVAFGIIRNRLRDWGARADAVRCSQTTTTLRSHSSQLADPS